MGRDIVCGYGVTHCPSQPGTHVRYAQIFAPKSSSIGLDFCGYMFGAPAEYIDATQVLHKSQGREVTRVENVGAIKIKFTIATKNMELFGFEILKS